MTDRKDFKKIVRDRMAETGETYTAANAALTPPSAQPDPGSGDSAGPFEGTTRRVKPPLVQLTLAAFDEAARLGHSWLGPEHGLLAIIHGDESDPARKALLDAGVTGELIERFAPAEETGPIDGDGTRSNPAWHQIHGRAEGIAAGLGQSTPATVCFVAAMLWDDSRWLRYEDDVRRQDVIDALRRQGAQLPSSTPPPFDRLHFTQRIEVPLAELSRVVKAISARRGENGPRFGFNNDGDIGWVTAEDGLDLQGIVDEVLAHPDS